MGAFDPGAFDSAVFDVGELLATGKRIIFTAVARIFTFRGMR